MHLKKYEFDLTTLGFNDQTFPVPSRSFNRVPTALDFNPSRHMVGQLVGWSVGWLLTIDIHLSFIFKKILALQLSITNA